MKNLRLKSNRSSIRSVGVLAAIPTSADRHAGGLDQRCRCRHQRSTPLPLFWQELGSDELNNVMKTSAGAESDLEAALHRIDQPRPSQDRRLLTVPADRSQRRITQFSRPAERQHGAAPAA